MRINQLPLFALLVALLPLSAMAHGGTKNTAEAIGVVHHIDREKSTLNITAQPIKKLGWSETTMDWKVAKGAKIDHLNVGDHVKFSLKQSNNRLTYHITHIEIINQKENHHG